MAKRQRDLSRAQRAAEIRAAQKRKERNRNLLIGGVVVVILSAIVAMVVITQQQKADEQAKSLVVPKNSKNYAVSYGDPGAKTKVLVYEDFQCPVCAYFESQTRTLLQEKAAKGEIYLQYRPISFLNEYSVRAQNAWAAVLNTMGPQAAEKYHNLLFENQPSEQGPKWPSNQDLIALAGKAGVPAEKIKKQVTSMRYQQWVANGTDDASKNNVNATPTIFVDGQQFGKQYKNIGQLVQGFKQRINQG